MTTDNTDRPYAFRGEANLERMMRQRQAGVEAAFVLPFLEAGMSVVDFGCGQGTITAGLAEAVAPAVVLGFDTQEEHIKRGEALAAERGLTNLTFQTGDVFDPPCEPASFDVVYANAVLSHLGDPEACLRLMRDVLTPGGLVAIRDRGGESLVTGQSWEASKRLNSLVLEMIDATSGNPYGSRIGEVMNRLCREAGFQVISISATWQISLASQLSAMVGRHPMAGPLGQRAIQSGLTTRAELDELIDKVGAQWATDPDAYMAIPWFEVVARKAMMRAMR